MKNDRKIEEQKSKVEKNRKRRATEKSGENQEEKTVTK